MNFGWLLLLRLIFNPAENYDNDQGSEIIPLKCKLIFDFPPNIHRHFSSSSSFSYPLCSGKSAHILWTISYCFLNAHIIWLCKCQRCDYCFNISTISKSKIDSSGSRKRIGRGSERGRRKKEEKGCPLIFMWLYAIWAKFTLLLPLPLSLWQPLPLGLIFFMRLNHHHIIYVVWPSFSFSSCGSIPSACVRKEYKQFIHNIQGHRVRPQLCACVYLLFSIVLICLLIAIIWSFHSSSHNLTRSLAYSHSHTHTLTLTHNNTIY